MSSISEKIVSRRRFIAGAAGVGVSLIATAFLWSACGQKEKPVLDTNETGTASVESCDDLSKLSTEELSVREKLGYVKESPIADNQCNNCNLYLPPSSEKKCGGCMLFKGPVHAAGYCTYWAPKI